MSKTALFFLVAVFFSPLFICAQESSTFTEKVFSFPDKFFASIQKKSDRFEQQLISSTTKYLNRLNRKELKLQRQLAKKDSAASSELFGDINKRYDSLRNNLKNPSAQSASLYSAHLDSMTTALRFLDQKKITQISPQLQGLQQRYATVQSKMDKTNFIQQQLTERQQFLQGKLEHFGLAKNFRKYQEGIYYYRTQLEEYKNIFEDSRKLEAALLNVVRKIPAFGKFFDKHSQLAGLFRLPGNDDPALLGADGLQTRSMVMQQLEQTLGTGPNMQAAMTQNIGNAQTMLEKAKEKLNTIGSGGAGMDMPGFKPSGQKTKSFFKRLEYGTNIQNSQGSSLLPVSTDIGLSIGYKINSRSMLGIGSSYRMGWGKDIRHISISHEGIGLRTFYDMKIKGNIWLTGGTEMNYRASFKHIEELKNYASWQQSALAGLSKKFAAGKRKGDMKVLYDFLHYRQVPRTQPLIFRIGYIL